jgi:hypothetical protein
MWNPRLVRLCYVNTLLSNNPKFSPQISLFDTQLVFPLLRHFPSWCVHREMRRRRGRRRKKLLDDLTDRSGYCQLKEEALDRTMWRNRFGRGFGPVVWQITDDNDDDDVFTLPPPATQRLLLSTYLCFTQHYKDLNTFHAPTVYFL